MKFKLKSGLTAVAAGLVLLCAAGFVYPSTYPATTGGMNSTVLDCEEQFDETAEAFDAMGLAATDADGAVVSLGSLVDQLNSQWCDTSFDHIVNNLQDDLQDAYDDHHVTGWNYGIEGDDLTSDGADFYDSYIGGGPASDRISALSNYMSAENKYRYAETQYSLGESTYRAIETEANDEIDLILLQFDFHDQQAEEIIGYCPCCE